MASILLLNTETLIGALFWGNSAAFAFFSLYYPRCKSAYERKIILYLIFAKLCHAAAYFLFYGRNLLPPILTVNVGNSAFFVGFFLEAQVILLIVRQRTRTMVALLAGILAATLFIFNAVEFLFPSSGLRVTVASLCVVLLMLLPNMKMLLARDTSPFAKSVAVLYSLFLLLLLPRAWHSLINQDVGILSSTVVQSLTFEALLIILLFSLPAYVLIVKEYTENTLFLMATTDNVTGAANRRAFLDAAEAVYDNYLRLSLPLTLLFIDIDHFKKVNDVHGHAFGDVVLQKLSEIIEGCLRGSDLSCRYGGEEFLILLPNAGVNTARVVGERIMQEIERLEFEDKPGFAFTVSIGVYTGTAGEGHTLNDFISRADGAMYQAKNAGRNRMVFSGE